VRFRSAGSTSYPELARCRLGRSYRDAVKFAKFQVIIDAVAKNLKH